MASLETPLDGGFVCTDVTEKIPVIGRLLRKKRCHDCDDGTSDEDGHKGVKMRIH
jgi:hypothetical protein